MCVAVAVASRRGRLREGRVPLRAEKKAGAVIITALDEVAWLLNLRGADVDYNPIFISYIIVTPDAATLYIDSAKVGTICQNTSPATRTYAHCMRE